MDLKPGTYQLQLKPGTSTSVSQYEQQTLTQQQTQIGVYDTT